MVVAAKLEVLATGEVSLDFFNESEAWQKVFTSLTAAAKEAERLGVFDSATRRYVEHVTESTDRGYIDNHVEVRVNQLVPRGFTKLR